MVQRDDDGSAVVGSELQVAPALADAREAGTFEWLSRRRSAGAAGSRGNVDRRDDQRFGKLETGLVLEVEAQRFGEVRARFIDRPALARDLDLKATSDVPVVFVGDRCGQSHETRIPMRAGDGIPG